MGPFSNLQRHPRKRERGDSTVDSRSLSRSNLFRARSQSVATEEPHRLPFHHRNTRKIAAVVANGRLFDETLTSSFWAISQAEANAYRAEDIQH